MNAAIVKITIVYTNIYQKKSIYLKKIVKIELRRFALPNFVFNFFANCFSLVMNHYEKILKSFLKIITKK